MRKLAIVALLLLAVSCGDDDGGGGGNDVWETRCLDAHTKLVKGPYNFTQVLVVERCP